MTDTIRRAAAAAVARGRLSWVSHSSASPSLAPPLSP